MEQKKHKERRKNPGVSSQKNKSRAVQADKLPKEKRPQIEQQVSDYESQLQRKFRREEDVDLIAEQTLEYRNKLILREIAKDNVPEEHLRKEEHSLISGTFVISITLMVFFVIAALVAGDKIEWAAGAISSFFIRYFSWFYLLLSTGILIYLVYLSLSRFGNVVLGEPDSKPEFSDLSWVSMLFSAGMGVGLLFWGAAEPLLHYVAPPTGTPSSLESARMSIVYTAFHWGMHGWAIYTVCAVAIAYFGFRKRKKYLISSCILEIFPSHRAQYYLKLFADVVAALAVVFGVAASLGMGLDQTGKGLSIIFGIDGQTTLAKIIILAAITVCFLISAGTGLKKGIKILSNANMLIAISLMLFVFLAGPKLFILKTFVNGIGSYISELPRLSFQMMPMSEGYEEWMGKWTILYFTWWISWAPFVGVFIARISRGRTVRQLIVGALLIPTIFSLLWFSVFGGSAMFIEWKGIFDLAAVVNTDVTESLFALLRQYPLFFLTSGTAIFLVFTFLVTSADSATFVISMMTTEGDLDPGTGIKVVWGAIIAAVTLILSVGGGLSAIQAAALVSALPFSFVLILMIMSLTIRLKHQVAVRRI
jgi:glycine betaine transporter